MTNAVGAALGRAQAAGIAAPPVELFVPFVSRVRPVAVKLGQVIVGARILGTDPDTGRLPDGFEAQCRRALDVMRAALEQGGAGIGNVAQVTIFFRDMDLKPTLNDVWTDLYPDPDDRPPHKYVPVDLPPGVEALLSFVAVAGATRTVLAIPGMQHVDPMSMGALTGNLLFSSRVVGTDTKTGKTEGTAEQQAAVALENVRTLLSQAGLDPEALTQVVAFITGAENQEAMQRPWRELFGNAERQPELRVVETNLPGNAYVRLEVKAVAGDQG